MEKRMLLDNVDLSSRRSAHEIVAKVLRDEIVAGRIAPGERLRQEEISKSLDVSQATVREAFRRLEGENLVISFQNRGVFVTEISLGQIEELYDLRERLETLAVESNISSLHKDRFFEATQLLEDYDQGDQFSFMGQRNRDFHRIFYSSPERRLTQDLLDNFFGNLTRQWTLFVRERPRDAQAYEASSRAEHHHILAAFQARDGAAAASAVKEHIRHARSTMLGFLHQRGTAPKG